MNIKFIEIQQTIFIYCTVLEYIRIRTYIWLPSYVVIGLGDQSLVYPTPLMILLFSKLLIVCSFIQLEV